ncbi:SgcJ/EcaC family oxidoreductase [Sorangium sp. So ce1389]|uniref:SgcJ/EcaC family oxidoreductase n=1 Tax=Sorangium sp. So ce1389 TaxID=3133336 RepID=UPI003F626217
MDRSTDEAAIRRMFEALSEAWAREGASAVDRFYTPDSDYVTFDGSWLRGREANRRAHEELFAGVLAGTRLVGEIEGVRFLGPDTAVVVSSGAVLWPWQRTAPASRRSRQTLVVVRGDDGRWRVASFQNTRVQRLPPSDSLFMRLFVAVLRFRLALWRRRHPEALAS